MQCNLHLAIEEVTYSLQIELEYSQILQRNGNDPLMDQGNPTFHTIPDELRCISLNLYGILYSSSATTSIHLETVREDSAFTSYPTKY